MQHLEKSNEWIAAKGGAFGPNIRVVKAEEQDIEDAEHLNRDVGLELGQLQCVTKPRPLKGLTAKGIAPGQSKLCQ